MTVFIYHPLIKLLKKLASLCTSTKPSAMLPLIGNQQISTCTSNNETLWDGIIKLSDTHLNFEKQ